MQYKKLILSCFILIIVKNFSYAQRAEIGVNVGGSGYIGEFNQFNPVKISGLNAGIYARLNIDPYWGIGIQYNYGKIKGDDARADNAQLRDRNLNFNTSLNEIAFIATLNFFDMYSPGSKKRVSPFLFAGVGGVIFEPRAEWGVGPPIKLREYNTEALPKQYRNYAMTFPYGVGVKYKKSENITLFGQIGYRTVFTDYLDDVSREYPDPSAWSSANSFNPVMSKDLSDRSWELAKYSSPIYKPGDQRGDFRKRDTYVFVNIGISYTFVSPKCFTF